MNGRCIETVDVELMLNRGDAATLTREELTMTGPTEQFSILSDLRGA